MALDRGKMVRYAAIGTEFFSPIVVGPVVGHYLDLRFGTDPWLTVGMFLLGVFAGSYNLVREVGRFRKDLES